VSSRTSHFLIAGFILLLAPGDLAADNILAPASERFSKRNTPAVPSFQKHVVPLLGRLGCNSAKCHGSFQGQGNFRLSLFGFDFQSDLAALCTDASSEDGSRLVIDDPENSLIVRKPTEQTGHEGGKRFEAGSWEHNLLLRWIESGAQGAKSSRTAAPSTGEVSRAVAFFRKSIKPIFEDHCYECHGFNSRKGKLSLATRESMLIGGASGPAIVSGKPEVSLLIKAVRHASDKLQMPPAGKLAENNIAALKKWVQMGAPWPEKESAPGDTGQVLANLRYEPAEILFDGTNATRQIRVIVEWEDGTREDVTCLARFQTNNDAVVQVSRDGLATSTGKGDTHIIAFYDNGVAAIPVLAPHRGVREEIPPEHTPVLLAHPIDAFVNAKLRKLRITPSSLCTDAEYLRRVSIDLTGTLPTPDEVKTFLKDRSSNKRNLKVDELLDRSTYAAWWANKLCDYTGCSPKSISSLLEVAREDGYVKASRWYDWVYERVRRNEPYDRLVMGIVLDDLTGRGDGMPYFWTRQSLKEPKDTAMSVAHAFLGIQLQCAECHKHPFDRWTQADFRDFAQFFDSVTKTKRRSAVSDSRNLRLLRSQMVTLQPGDDPRRPVMEWMQGGGKSLLARAFVNRVWASYFHVGIVEPPDQFTPANPPSHPRLLDWLAEGFIANDYDMKWLHRQIATSRTYQRSWKPNETNRSDRRNFSRAIPRRIPAEVVYDAMKQATAATSQQKKVRTDLRRRASGHLSMRMAGTHAMKVFGKPDRLINCDCERVSEPTLLQAIFTQNDPLVRMRIADSAWIIEIDEAEEDGKPIDSTSLISDVWLRTVGRFPTQEERRRATRHFESSQSVSQAASDLMWAMMNTKEFLLNH